jgi:nucleotide-binding universal stress UspA family protein
MSHPANTPAANVVFRTVLITTDFSELANRALPYAAALLPNGGRIHLINVQHPRCLPSGQYHQGPWDAEGQTAHREHIKICHDRLNALVRGGAFGPGIEPTVDVIESQDAGKAIVAAAAKLAADVICLSSHGYTGFRAIVLGSVAEAVLSHSTCPVFIVRQTG